MQLTHLHVPGKESALCMHNFRSPSYFRVMMSSWPRAGPSSALPAAHSFELRRVINLYNAVDLAIWMLMVLASILLLAIHENGSDAEISCFIFGQAHSRSSILLTVHFNISTPSFILFDTLSNEFAEVLVIWVPRTIIAIQIFFEVLPRRSRFSLERTLSIQSTVNVQILYFGKELSASSN